MYVCVCGFHVDWDLARTHYTFEGINSKLRENNEQQQQQKPRLPLK